MNQAFHAGILCVLQCAEGLDSCQVAIRPAILSGRFPWALSQPSARRQEFDKNGDPGVAFPETIFKRKKIVAKPCGVVHDFCCKRSVGRARNPGSRLSEQCQVRGRIIDLELIRSSQ